MSAINSTFLPVAMATSLHPLAALEDLGRPRAAQAPSCVAGAVQCLATCGFFFLRRFGKCQVKTQRWPKTMKRVRHTTTWRYIYGTGCASWWWF